MLRKALVVVIALFTGGVVLAADDVTKLTSRELAVATNDWRARKSKP